MFPFYYLIKTCACRLAVDAGVDDADDDSVAVAGVAPKRVFVSAETEEGRRPRGEKLPLAVGDGAQEARQLRHRRELSLGEPGGEAVEDRRVGTHHALLAGLRQDAWQEALVPPAMVPSAHGFRRCREEHDIGLVHRIGVLGKACSHGGVEGRSSEQQEDGGGVWRVQVARTPL